VIIPLAIALATGLLVNQFSELAAWSARKLVRRSAFYQYTDPARAETRAEELDALINECPGNLFKLLVAIGFIGKAATLAARGTLTLRARPDTIAAQPLSRYEWLRPVSTIAAAVLVAIAGGWCLSGLPRQIQQAAQSVLLSQPHSTSHGRSLGINPNPADGTHQVRNP
jgi:hypothetical protein